MGGVRFSAINCFQLDSREALLATQLRGERGDEIELRGTLQSQAKQKGRREGEGQDFLSLTSIALAICIGSEVT